MSQAVSSAKKSVIDKRIDEYCEKSAELLADIHERHKSKGAKKPQQKRKGRPPKNTL